MTAPVRYRGGLICVTRQLNHQNAKLEFVGMPPRAMRAFARVVVFPSFGHARFVFAVVVYSI